MIYMVVITGQLHYRVTGTRGTVPVLGFGTQAGAYGQAGGLKTVDYKEVMLLF